MTRTVQPSVPSPAVWGPSAWKFLDAVAAGFPSEPSAEDQENYKKFFESLADVLPCPACREHFDKILSARTCDARSTSSLRDWVHDVHNDVNAALNKEKVFQNSWVKKDDQKANMPKKRRTKKYTGSFGKDATMGFNAVWSQTPATNQRSQQVYTEETVLVETPKYLPSHFIVRKPVKPCDCKRR